MSSLVGSDRVTNDFCLDYNEIAAECNPAAGFKHKDCARRGTGATRGAGRSARAGTRAAAAAEPSGSGVSVLHRAGGRRRLHRAHCPGMWRQAS